MWSPHLSFLWAPLGLLLLGFAVVAPQLPAPMAGLHALTAAAIGSMTLAVMTRAALGHSGREFAADGWTELICLTVAAAAALRVAPSAVPEPCVPLLQTSCAAWTVAFALLVAGYGRIHLLV